jgi:hypothetical protein
VRQRVHEDAGHIPAIAGLEGALGQRYFLAVDGVRGAIPSNGEARIAIDPDIGVTPDLVEGPRCTVGTERLARRIARRNLTAIMSAIAATVVVGYYSN